MNQDNRDEMPEEIDFSGGVRGKYYARFHRTPAITSAIGSLQLHVVSTGDQTAKKLDFHLSDVHISFGFGRPSPLAAPPQEVLVRRSA